MPKIQWEPKVNAGHVLLAGSLMLSGIGLYYNTQAKIASEASVREMADKAQERDIKELQASRDKLADLIERVNGKTDTVRMDFERHQARTERVAQ